MHIFTSATMTEAFDKLILFLRPITEVVIMALIAVVFVLIVHLVYSVIKDHTQDKEKERQYKYINSSNSDTKSRLEIVNLKKKDKV